jgi:hypothetical protein
MSCILFQPVIFCFFLYLPISIIYKNMNIKYIISSYIVFRTFLKDWERFN